jgi:hypothetical protein
MPDHVHLVLSALYDGNSFYSIAEIMQGIKSASAHHHLLVEASRAGLATRVIRPRVAAGRGNSSESGIHHSEPGASRFGADGVGV